ncbi:FAD-binding oxidoreductase [Nocardioides convexus]|uniref:FAD-binding oxidoreductase n=1 Tax=Nocardioides convexus TaxID=2712224 RepID=UPI0024181AC5|nr:FAD-binding oxidoreductase [Nocardioides convexus]
MSRPLRWCSRACPTTSAPRWPPPGSLGLTVTARGAGTSVAGNAIGPGIVLDFSRHMNQVLSIDGDAATAVVQPGVVQAALQAAAAPYGLRFGPDPSTSTRCTIGGMIGNDACGARSLAFGRTSHNTLGLRALLADGTEPGDRPRHRAGRERRAGPGPRRGRSRPGDRAHRVRHLRAARLRAGRGAPPARAVRPHPGPGRLRGHPRGAHRGHGPPGRHARRQACSW